MIKKMAELTTHTCLGCGKIFHPVNWNQQYCTKCRLVNFTLAVRSNKANKKKIVITKKKD